MYVAERFLFQLDENLKPLSEVQPHIDISNNTKEILLRDGFEQVVSSFNNSVYGYKEINLKDFDGAILFPNIEYSQKYQLKHTIHPVGVGVILPHWDNVSKKIRTKSSGQAFDDIMFNESTIHLEKLGFIMHSTMGDVDINMEHELMHMDNDTYSRNNTLLRRFYNGIRSDDISFKIENEVKRELIAYRNELDGKASEMGKFLANGRLYFYVEWLASLMPHPQAKQALAYILSPMREKIQPATDAMEYLNNEVPSQLLTPLLFTIGPTITEIRDGKIVSVLDDIVKLAECYSKKEIQLDQLSDKIRNKGYTI